MTPEMPPFKTTESSTCTSTSTRFWLKELILENFMSYEYARIPLKPGLNLISGPNGAGKSSILLAISVALGQIYTERSKRLKDLIRRGSEIARITLVFDNEVKEGERPISFSDTDTFLLSRYIRNDGNYWWEADYKRVSHDEVTRLFKGFGLDPNNMLIIMHQNTMERFSQTTPQEKLKLLEEAVGFCSYREKVIEAANRLESIISEDESSSDLLGRAEESLGYWKEMHKKFMLREELEDKRSWLKREAIWSRVLKQEAALKTLEEQLKEKEHALDSNQAEADRIKEYIKEWRDAWKTSTKDLFHALLYLEKETRLNDLKEAISKVQSELGALERTQESIMETYIDNRVKAEVLAFKRELLEADINTIEVEMASVKEKLADLESLKRKAGERIATERKQSEIENELSLVGAKIEALGEIPEETEEIYTNYSRLFAELEERAKVVAVNKREAQKELESRNEIWRNAMTDLLGDINSSFQRIMSSIDAVGLARLVNHDDIATAGLALFVGFRGAPPVLFDYYTQSGGEKTASIMAFLLSIQQMLRSPFRAVDEFDIHMDPRNREEIYKMMISTMKDVECLLITPGQITVTDPRVHVIVVQKTYGKSRVQEVKEE
ncbi:MAG: AAA family ATPase [Halobacteriota archaeon]